MTNTQNQFTLKDIVLAVGAGLEPRFASLEENLKSYTDEKFEELALMVGKQFNAIDKRFDRLEGVQKVSSAHSEYFKGIKTVLKTA